MADTQVTILITAIDEASQAFKSVLDNSESMANKLSKTANTLGELGDMATDFTEPLAKGLKASKTAAIDFESGMAEVRKTTGLSAAQTAELGNEIKKLSRTIPLTTKELTDIGVAAGQSGVAMKDIPNYVKEISKASVALAVDTDKAGLAFGRLQNIYGMSNAEIPKLAAAINVLGDSSVASEKEILNVIMRTAALSKQANLTAKDSAALGASFVSLGMAPNVAATAINALLSRMTTAEIQSARFQQGLAMIGMSGKELQNMTSENGVAAIQALGAAVDKLDPQERAKAIGLMFGAEHSDNVGIFLDRMDVFKNALGSVANDQSNVNRYNQVFATQLDTTASKMQLLNNSFQELAIEIGTALLPAIKAFAAFLTPIINKVTEFAAKHPNIVRLGSALAGLAISIGPFLFAMATLAKAWSLFSAGIPIVAALSNKFLGVGNPISKMLNWLAGANQRLLGIGKASDAISPPDLMGKMGKLPKIEECLPVCICPEICDDFEAKLKAIAQQITYCIPICICPEDCEGGKALPTKGESPASTIGQNPLLPKAEENIEGTATIQPTQEAAQQASIANAQQLTAIFLASAQQLAAIQIASAQQLAATQIASAQQLAATQLASAQQLAATFLTSAQQLAATQIASAQQLAATFLTSAQQLAATFLTSAQQLTATLLASIQQIATTFLTNAQQLGAIQLASAQQAGLILVTSAQEVGATLLASIQGLGETLLAAAQQLGAALQLGAQEAGSIIVVSAQEAGSILVAAAQEAGAVLSGIIQEASSMLAEASSMLAASAQEVAIQSENAREVSAQRSSGGGLKTAALVGLGAAGIGGAVFGLGKVIGGIGGAVKGGVGALFGGVQSAAGALSMNAAKGAATLGATASKVVGGIGGAIGGAASNVAGAVGGVVNNAVGAAKMGAGFAGGAIKGAASGALNAAGGAVKGAASGALSAAGGAAKSAASSALGAAGGAIKGVAGSALGAVGGTAGLAKAATAAAPIASAAAGIAAGSEKAQPTNTISKFTRSQSTETPASDLATQSTAAAKNNIVPLVRSSNESGKAISSGLAKGIESSKPQAELAAAGLAQSVSSYLPRSPAEKGPLSDLDKTGFGLTQEFIKGIDGSAIQNKFEDVMNPPSKFAGIDVGSSGGNSSNNAVYSPTYNLSGTQPENFIAELEKHDRKFIEWLQQTQERFNRGRY